MDKAIFLDRDGTLVNDPGFVHKIKDFKLLPGVIEGLKKLSKEFIFIIITNQAGIGRKVYTEKDMLRFNEKLTTELKNKDIEIKNIYYCPHTPEDNCDCRKPSTKYIKQAAKEFDIDVKQSWIIGDRQSDIEMGIRAGSKAIYLLTGYKERHLNDLEKKDIKPDFITENFLEAAEFIIKNQ